MDSKAIDAIAAWLTAGGLAGMAEPEMMQGFCERCCAAGIPLARGVAVIDTLHPIYEGRAFRWRNDGVEEPAIVEYGRTDVGEAAESWRRSVFYHMTETGADEHRQRLGADIEITFPGLIQMRAEGQTDYLAMIHRFPGGGSIGEMDCIYFHWCSADPEGFADEHLDALRRLVPSLALPIKCAALARIARTLVDVYLGKDAGQRVLSGRIARGVADRIQAVLWYSDLHDYTSISDTAAPDEIMPLLNDYADVVISSVHEAGGNVLKLIGDGTLAIFKSKVPGQACRQAFEAEANLRQRLGALKRQRREAGRPVTTIYLGLHVGEVFYGNIGSEDRLDFTVVGPAVNEVARIASMCRSVDRHVVMSDAFAEATPDELRPRLVSVGRYALRGVGRAQELFTLDPALIVRR